MNELVFHKKIPDIMKVIQIGDVIDQGITSPIRCVLSNGMEAVVKYQKNRSGTFALVNEWIGNQIADLISLTIPEYGICDLSLDIINQSEHDVEIDKNNAGLAFFSRYLPDTVPISNSLLEKMTNRETEKVILFDILTGDFDRHQGNILCSIKYKKMVFIDCSHITTSDGYSLNTPINIPKALSQECLTDISILTAPKDNIYDKLCNSVGFRKDILREEGKRIRNILTDAVLEMLFESIPQEWISSDFAKQRVADLKSVIKCKTSMLDQLICIIEKERSTRSWKTY